MEWNRMRGEWNEIIWTSFIEIEESMRQWWLNMNELKNFMKKMIEKDDEQMESTLLSKYVG